MCLWTGFVLGVLAGYAFWSFLDALEPHPSLEGLKEGEKGVMVLPWKDHFLPPSGSFYWKESNGTISYGPGTFWSFPGRTGS